MAKNGLTSVCQNISDVTVTLALSPRTPPRPALAFGRGYHHSCYCPTYLHVVYGSHPALTLSPRAWGQAGHVIMAALSRF